MEENLIKKIELSSKLQIIILILFIIFLFEQKNYELKKISNFNPKVSVFLPIYNKSKYLIRSISSIQSQTLIDIEIVAVNDGSTDNSLKILKKLSKKDNRIKIINNDRNHGLLYSRAMGIINSNGEFVMDLDPDDILEGNNNLKILYNKAFHTGLDLLIFLIKRVPINKSEIEKYNLINKLQLTKEDFVITNKFMKRETILKVAEILNKNINGNKWNYHEDNIWNVLVRRHARKISTINKYIYIYKRNNDSLMLNKGNLVEIKNRIYRLKMLLKINNNKNNSYENYFYKDIIKVCNISVLTNYEIKKKLIDTSIYFLNIFKKNDESLTINFLINKILDNKIIIFYNSNNTNLIDYLTHLTIFQILQDNINKKIISVDGYNKTQVDDIVNYIYSNDILIGLDDIFFHDNFDNIFNNFNGNKLIIFANNIYIENINNNISLMNYSNIVIYISNNISYNIFEDVFENKKLYFFPDFITNIANYINNNNKRKNNFLILLYTEKTNENINIIKNIIFKYYDDLTYINLNENHQNLTDLIHIIKEYKFVFTDTYLLMKISAIYFTSCIYYEINDTINIMKYTDTYNLNYIKYINDLNELEQILKDFNNNYFNSEMYYNNLDLIIKEFI